MRARVESVRSITHGSRWPSAVGSIVVALLAVPAGWMFAVAVGIPADRGEESSAIILGIAGAIVWVALISLAAWLAYWRRGALGHAIFLPTLVIVLLLSAAPWVVGALIAAAVSQGY